jgi:acetyl esterase/lipase
MTPRSNDDADRKAANALTFLAIVSAIASVVGNTNALDRALRRILPGLASAGSVVPLFLTSLIASEFPLHLVAGEAAVTARLLPRALRRRRGRVSAAVLVAAWLAKFRAQRTARRTVEVLDDALNDALGSDHRQSLPDEVARDTPLRLQHTWIPKLSERRRYLRHENLSYGDAGVRNHVDIWHRDDLPSNGRAPVLVHIHGSAWVALSKQGQGYPLMAHMAERGWVCVTINYSLAPAARWPAHIIDVKRALAWVKREIPAYGGDPAAIALTGGSAGGQLTALAALTPNEPVFQPGFESADTSVIAAVPFYGLYDLLDRAHQAPAEQEAFLTRVVIGKSRHEAPEIWDQGSPMSWLRSDAPPFFILHGAIDTMTLPTQARTFAEGLREVSCQPVAYAELPGAQHMFDSFPTVRGAAAVAAVDRFLSHVIRKRAEAETIKTPGEQGPSSGLVRKADVVGSHERENDCYVDEKIASAISMNNPAKPQVRHTVCDSPPSKDEK